MVPTHRSASSASPRVPAAPLAPPPRPPLAARQRPRPLLAGATPFCPNTARHWPACFRPRRAIGSGKCHSSLKSRPPPASPEGAGFCDVTAAPPAAIGGSAGADGAGAEPREGRGRVTSRDSLRLRPSRKCGGRSSRPAGGALGISGRSGDPPQVPQGRFFPAGGALCGPQPLPGSPTAAFSLRGALFGRASPHTGEELGLCPLRGAGFSPRPLGSALTAFRGTPHAL